ncbi:MAG TPA: DNA polymerase III subunit gamma/tau [Gammaproteobacteria bacterium]|nr:DNA polymerase III subunit gamma/tau [Gammaproteobacteria bacterium]
MSSSPSHLVLARKYRPQSFAETMGQEHVLRALQNALETNRLHHAYLLTGTRGVGKTTIARIFAKCLSCEKGVTATPCNTCSSCTEINAGRYIDLLEIDAASRTKVEDTRDLLDNVQYLPQRGRYKIYLIDEVHMLSGHSFNALLKTLEEPPAHVIFILATTDPQKLPVTVLSRCLQFHLKNMSSEQIIAQLKIILDKEAISYELNALELISKAAQGSMRDALSLLDQAISHGQNSIKEINVTEMLGLIPAQKVVELLSLVHSQNKESLINTVNNLAELNIDFLALLDEIIILLQKLAVDNFLNKTNSALNLKPEDIQLYYQIALLSKRDLPLSPDPKLGFLMCLIRMMVFTPAKFTQPVKPVSHPVEAKVPVSTPVSTPASAPTSNAWQDIIATLNLTGITLLLAQNCVMSKKENEITLTVDESQKAMLVPAAKERLEKAIQTHFGSACQISIIIGKSNDTPAKQVQKTINDAREKVQQEVLSDPTVQSIMQNFSATIEDITPT